MNKFKNYSFMCGLISAILMVIVQVLAAFDIYISNETVSNIVSVVLGALVVLGVINKPSSGDSSGGQVSDSTEQIDTQIEENCNLN